MIGDLMHASNSPRRIHIYKMICKWVKWQRFRSLYKNYHPHPFCFIPNRILKNEFESFFVPNSLSTDSFDDWRLN